MEGTHLTASPEMTGFVLRFDQLVANVSRGMHGKDQVVRAAISCVLAEGHLLIEDVPGVGKTSLARAIAASVALTWNRIQFTPDLLPSDVTGVSVFDQATSTFSFRPGVRQHRPRRRDQPGVAEDAVGAARGDAGTDRHHRRHRLPRAPPLCGG